MSELTDKEKCADLHWYSFVFQTTRSDGALQTASIYMGYPDQKITVGRVQDAKRSSGISPTSVMLGVSYLGFMERKIMTAGPSWSAPEQKLVDLIFEITGVAMERTEFFAPKTHEERMQWVAHQLQQCGFPTTPVGMSWGVLDTIPD